MDRARVGALRTKVILAFLWVATLWLAFQSGKGYQSKGALRAPMPGTFVLDIQFTFSSTAHRDTFINLWRPLARHVREREEGTLSYELAIADSDPLKVLVFERYVSKDDYHVHKASKPFEDFHIRLRDSGLQWTSKEGQSFIEAGVGFV